MIELVPPIAVESPCVGLCVIGDDDLCQGCARTIDEIAGWLGLDERQRAAIIATFPERRATI